MRDGAALYALLVNNDIAVRMEAADILENAGFRTFTAPNGDAAAQLLAEHHASIVLLFTDVQMLGSLDGFALARKTAALYPHIAIVIASGTVQPDPADLPDGTRFIGKRFSAEMIRNLVREILPNGLNPEPLRKA